MSYTWVVLVAEKIPLGIPGTGDYLWVVLVLAELPVGSAGTTGATVGLEGSASKCSTVEHGSW